MTKRSSFLILAVLLVLEASFPLAGRAENESGVPGASASGIPSGTKKVKTVYKSHTQLDFTGQSVEGEARTPEIFYIFQRKRSGGHNVLTPPKAFANHRDSTRQLLEEALPSPKKVD